MVPAGSDHDALVAMGLALDRVNEPVFAGDAARPEPREFTLERLRPADALERGSSDVFDQFVHSTESARIMSAPMKVIVPTVIGKMNPQTEAGVWVGATNSCSWVVPVLICRTDAIRRSAFFGLLSK